MEDLSYLELDLPGILQEALDGFKIGLKKYENNEGYTQFDLDFDLLASQINVCEVEQMISKKQANYLRKIYLGYDIDIQ